MERIEVDRIQPGQAVTLEFGDKEAILTRLDRTRRFKLEDWYEEEREITLLDDVIAEEAPLRYTLDPVENPAAVLATGNNRFGAKRSFLDFLGRPVESIEMDDPDGE